MQPEIYEKTNAQLQETAQALLAERITDSNVTVTVDAVDTNTDDGQLYLRAEITVPMSFVSLVGVEQMTTQISSQVTRKKLYVEASFVLDNSGSMTGTKISSLKTAAINAINILFYGTTSPSASATKASNTKVAIVPFTFFVNVGSGYANETWVDGDGYSSIATDNLDNDDDDSVHTLTEIDRIDDLFGTLSNESWKGCFESRPYPYSVDDTTPSSSVPDTLFVPEFAPDEPGDAGYPDSGFNNSYVDDSPSSCDISGGTCNCTTTYSDNTFTLPFDTPRLSLAAYGGDDGFGFRIAPPLAEDHLFELARGGGGSHGGGGGSSSTTTCTLTYPDGSTETGDSSLCSCSYSYPCSYDITPSGLSDRELQERICKYDGASVQYAYDSSTHENYTQGPNAGCPDADIQPLTDNVTTLTTKINAMVADGGTNIHEGTAWGFRTLSPSVPFTEGRDYDTATSKVLIIMTDGENTYWHVNKRYDSSATPNMNGTYYYMPYGYQYNDRLTMHPGSTSYLNSDGENLQLAMNDLTLEACENAKDAGITIYTIGLQSPNTDDDQYVDQACASETSKAYFPSPLPPSSTAFSSRSPSS